LVEAASAGAGIAPVERVEAAIPAAAVDAYIQVIKIC